MAAIEKLRSENRQLVDELRFARLRAGALERLVESLKERLVWVAGRPEYTIDEAVKRYKSDTEHPLRVRHRRSLDAVYRALRTDPMEDTATFEDLATVPRALVAGTKGVGPATMRELDEGLAEHGLAWSEEGGI